MECMYQNIMSTHAPPANVTNVCVCGFNHSAAASNQELLVKHAERHFDTWIHIFIGWIPCVKLVWFAFVAESVGVSSANIELSSIHSRGVCLKYVPWYIGVSLL